MLQLRPYQLEAVKDIVEKKKVLMLSVGKKIDKIGE